MTEKDEDKPINYSSYGGGYTSVTLGELLERVDQQSADSGINNRSLMIRLILQEYYTLKEKGVDILKMEADDIVKKVKR